MCLLTTILVSVLFYIAKSDLNDYIGFGISTGLQSTPLSAWTVGSITSKLNAKTYKIYGWPSGPAIAQQIIAQSSHPDEIKFIIEYWDLNAITTSVIDQLIADYSAVEDNVYCINIGNEPLNGNNGASMTWDILADKLELVYKHLATKSSPWNNVKVSIPFSEAIMDVSWPVNAGTFKSERQSELRDILSVLDKYNGPVSINLYPYFTLPSQYEQYALGNQMGDGGNKWYNNMLEAKYDAVKYAMENIYTGAYNNIEVIITETGWSSQSASSAKASFSTVSNARDYIGNVLKSMNDASSILYQKKIYFFELFDEDQKASSGDWEAYFGIYDKSGNSKGIYSDPTCSNGIDGGIACCSAGCGSCGGSGCGSMTGGASACCYNGITGDANSCNFNQPPCVIG